MKKRIYIKTWGCEMNKYDSVKILEIFKNNKYKKAKNYKKANILILNTCSIRKKVEEKLYNLLNIWKKFKEKKKKKIIIAVGGCTTLKERKKIINKFNFVNIIFNSKTLHKLPKIVINFIKNKKNKNIIKLKTKKYKKFNLISKVKKTKTSITIIEGCNNKCSYCVVPFTRGKQISRSYKDIIKEIKYHTVNGIKEICLLGQNVNSYKFINTKKIVNFSKLILLISKIKKIKRIKFITSNPKNFTKNVINIYKKTKKLMDYLHLPIQSGSNKILNKMKRGYSVENYKKIIKKLRIIRPNISISTDFITGYPGEKKKDFIKTIKIIKKINFDNSFTFIYSKRPGTKSYKTLNILNKYEKKYRLYKIQKEIKKKLIKLNLKNYSSIQEILIEKKKKNNKLLARTNNNKLIKFKSKKNLIGKLLKIKINNINKNFLNGKIIY